MNALVVAADATLRQRLASFFRGRGHTVVAHSEADAAARELHVAGPQYVLVDLDTTGALELCRRVHQPGAAGGRPDAERHLLVLTGEESPERLRGAFEAGADDYLLKPVATGALKLRLALGERALAARRHRLDLDRRRELGEKRYRTLVESMAEGLFEVDAQGIIRFANSSLSRITGYSGDEILGHKADDLLIEDAIRDRLPGRTLLGSGVGSEQYTLPLRGKDGRSLWVTMTAAPLPDSGHGASALGVLQDITEQKKAEEALRHREEYFRVLWENTSDLVSILDLDGRVLYQSVSSCGILGWSEDELVGRDFFALIHEDDRPDFATAFGASLESHRPTRFEIRLELRDGDWRYFEGSCQNLTENPVVGGLIVTARDVTERHRMEAALGRERTFFLQLFHNSPMAIVVLDPDDRIVECNRSFTELFQFEQKEIAGRELSDFIVPDDQRGQARELSQAVTRRQTVHKETVRRRKDGTPVEVAVIGYPVELANEKIGAFGLYVDISERKAAERKLFHDAFHDALTSLPNRMLLVERLERALRRALRHPEYLFALAFLDLDGFKAVNDSLGHAAGDELLVEVARRLTSEVRPGDTVARLGGDEFTLLLDDLDHPADASTVAQRILERISEPIRLEEEEVRISGSMGVAFSYTGYDHVDELMRDADVAMYRAKSRGKACYEIFDADMQQSVRSRHELEDELREALDSGALWLDCQPIVSLRSGEAVAWEAMLRWEHPHYGSIDASEIRSIAHETGLLRQLWRWTLGSVCRRAVADRQHLERSGGRLGVDVGLEELRHGDFLGDLQAVLKQTGARFHDLALELPESALADPIAAPGGLLEALRQRGVALVLDHFGRGPTAIAALARLGIAEIKLDAQLLTGDVDRTPLIQLTLAIARAVGCDVGVTGVTREEEAIALREIGLDRAQGPHYPMSAHRDRVGTTD